MKEEPDTRFELCHDVERVLEIGRNFQKQDAWRGAQHDTAKLLCDTIEYLRDRLNAPAGNMAAMRETLVALQARFEKNVMAYQDRYFKFTGWHWHKKAKEAARWRDVFSELNEQCRAALATPPRNCDRKFADQPAMYYEFKDWCNKKGHTMEPKLAYDAFDWLLEQSDKKGGRQ